MALQQLTTTGWQTVGGSGGGVTPDSNDYLRPSDWLALPDIAANEHKAYLLVAVWDNDPNSIRVDVGGTNITYDWGDGTVNTNPEHTFNYADFSGTESSRGYRQAVVTITGDSITYLRVAYLSLSIGVVTASTGRTAPLLDLHVGSSTLEYLSLGNGATGYTSCRLLTHIRVFSYSGIASSNWSFYNCSSLTSIEIPSPLVMGPYSSAVFQNCNSLIAAPDIDFTQTLQSGNFFSNCSSLKTFGTFIGGATCASVDSMFYGCSSMTDLPQFDLSGDANPNSIILLCNSLRTIPALNLSNVTITNFYGYYTYAQTQSLTWVDAYGYRYTHDLRRRMLSHAAIVNVFSNLGTAVSGATITISENPGSASVTADDIAIATAKGWTVVV